MGHDRKFVYSRVMGVIGRIVNGRECMFVQDEMERIIIESGILNQGIFKWVGLTYRIENQTRTTRPYTWKVDPKDGELPLAVVLDFDIMKWTDLYNVQLMKDIFMAAALDAMIFVAKKFKYPPDYFVIERNKYGPIPETVEECERMHNANPEQHLIDISKSEFPTQIITAFDEILNYTDSFERLKNYIHKLPAGLLETTIHRYQEACQAGTLSGYEFSDPQDHSAKCAELLDLIHSKP